MIVGDGPESEFEKSPVGMTGKPLVSVSDRVVGDDGTNEVTFTGLDEFDMIAVEELLENGDILDISLVTKEEDGTVVLELGNCVDGPASVVRNGVVEVFRVPKVDELSVDIVDLLSMEETLVIIVEPTILPFGVLEILVDTGMVVEVSSNLVDRLLGVENAIVELVHNVSVLDVFEDPTTVPVVTSTVVAGIIIGPLCVAASIA